jgi:Rrf2 family protein
MLSSRAQYAVVAMLQLAEEFAGGEALQVRRIAERHGVPANFLVQILLDLKRAGLVASVRGPSGGYRLGRSPEKISLADVADAVEAAEVTRSCAASRSHFAPLVIALCGDLSQSRREILQRATLADLVERSALAAGASWQI